MNVASTISFAAAPLLWGLVLVPLALATYVLAQRRRARYAIRFTNLDLLANVAPRRPGWRRHLPAALYLGALSTLLVALARPQAVVPVPRDEATVMLVMDVSGSMNANDVEPSRLAAAKSAAGAFLDQLPPQFRVGLVTFSSAAQSVAPPSVDRAAVRQAIGSLRALGGTAMGDGIELALETRSTAGAHPTSSPTQTLPGSGAPSPAPAEDAAPTVILLLSDGANSAGQTDPIEAATQAQQQGVPVFTVALGTQTGTLDLGGNRRMPVPPDERTLRQIAEITDGRFFSAPTQDDLKSIYQNLASRIGWVEQEQEVTVAFAAAALALLLTGGGLSLALFNRFP